jgi:hypothetical protein
MRFLIVLLALPLLSGARAPRECPPVAHLYGTVKVVEHFADCRVQVVGSFEDLRVQVVDHFPDAPGKWKIVDHFPDHTVTFVDHFPDLRIRYVDHFPGVR